MKQNPALYLFIMLLCNACFSIKPATTKTSKNLWEEFFVSPGVMQYFIKPLSFHHNEELFIADLTFRNGVDSVTVNFTEEENHSISSPVRVYFLTSKDSIQIKSIQTLLKEKTKKKFTLRKTGKISYFELKQLMAEDQWMVSLLNDSATKKYYPDNKTTRHLKVLKNSLFETIE